MHADGFGYAGHHTAICGAQQWQTCLLGWRRAAFAPRLVTAPIHIDRTGLLVLFLRVAWFG